MRIEQDIKLDYNSVLIRPKRSTLGSRKEVSLERDFTFRNYASDFPDNIKSYHYRGIPIMASNMDGVGTFEMADKLRSLGLFTCLVKTYSVNELVGFFDCENEDSRKARPEYTAYSMGITDADHEKFRMVYEQAPNIKYVCVDVANGYSVRFAEFIRRLREQYSDIIIIAGNVVTGEMTEELILSGADIIKVGIGPGSVCTTRIQTGVGYPQLSSIIECADAAHGLGGHIIADGGCVSPGDVAKAFAAGADFVMLGGMLAGHEESGGETITKDGQMYKVFYGMSSETAMDKYAGGVAEYRSSEGKTVKIPFRGALNNTIQSILGGIRSTCTYIGASKLKELPKCTTFVRVNNTHNKVFGDINNG